MSTSLSLSDAVPWQGHTRGFGASTEKKKSCSKSKYRTFEKSFNPPKVNAAFKDHTGGFACPCPLITSHIHTANYSPKQNRCFQIDFLPYRQSFQCALSILLQKLGKCFRYVIHHSKQCIAFSFSKSSYCSCKQHFPNFTIYCISISWTLRPWPSWIWGSTAQKLLIDKLCCGKCESMKTNIENKVKRIWLLCDSQA